jgi:hypothetical protein
MFPPNCPVYSIYNAVVDGSTAVVKVFFRVEVGSIVLFKECRPDPSASVWEKDIPSVVLLVPAKKGMGMDRVVSRSSIKYQAEGT